MAFARSEEENRCGRSRLQDMALVSERLWVLSLLEARRTLMPAQLEAGR